MVLDGAGWCWMVLDGDVADVADVELGGRGACACRRSRGPWPLRMPAKARGVAKGKGMDAMDRDEPGPAE
ncbi:hypothetical protein [Alicyclobacillus macrosporangiidus]|uniref:hypothetical protein n=1 Tax=Alicyclobacillus macrosporangiidus TaxID=392015 RepID=UPI001113BB24|nr:hypothetical protein [Alicyclobacillus macrosporangiidus]